MMQVILGIDIGTSATKIVAIDEKQTMIAADRTASSDPVSVCESSVMQLASRGIFAVGDIAKIMLTGVGASFITEDILGIPTFHVTEFESQGRGGLYLGGKSRAVVCSMGTGTTLIEASPEGFYHRGGSAVGGGTLTGLCSRLFGVSDPAKIEALADEGDLHRVDWHMGEINRDAIATLPDFATASNLGKMAADATDADVALGIYNMIYQTAGVMAALVCNAAGIHDVVVIGSMAEVRHAGVLLGQVGQLYNINFVTSKMPVYATAVGAAMAGVSQETD